MKAFLSTDVALANEEILGYYSKRWAIETYFRTAKVQLSMDRYQVCSTEAIDRYLTLLMFASMCCIYAGQTSLIHEIQRNTTLSLTEKAEHNRVYLLPNSSRGYLSSKLKRSSELHRDPVGSLNLSCYWQVQYFS
ncbi:transposase [Paenibacillus sp. F411]|nr:transposase [Paenibacillus sp. F411]MBO2944448.1 transposase [Paenibacillus sp. F411]